MKQHGFTLIEGLVCLAIFAILVAVIYPAIRPRPLMWSKTSMSPQHFQNAELQSVMLSLHRELYKKRKMKFLKDTHWEKEGLKHRKISFATSEELTLSQVFALIEKKSQVKFKGLGSCGTCGLPMGAPTVVDVSKSH